MSRSCCRSSRIGFSTMVGWEGLCLSKESPRNTADANQSGGYCRIKHVSSAIAKVAETSLEKAIFASLDSEQNSEPIVRRLDISGQVESLV